MKNKLLLLLSITLCFNLYAQQAVFKIKNNETKKAALLSLQGENTFFIDSLKAEDQGVFTFLFDQKKQHSGIYRLSFSKISYIDFIYDGEEVNIGANANNLIDSINVLTSESNKIFYSFIRLNRSFKTKYELLYMILLHYPKDDDYYKITSEKLDQLRKEYHKFVDNVSIKKPDSFVSKYIKTSQLSIAFVDRLYSPDGQIHYLKLHALDHVNFNDDELIYSDAFTNKAIEYLTFYRSPQLPKEQLEKEFKVAVDTLLNKAKVHQLVYQHIADYLISGFKKYGFDEVLDYMIENYVIKDDLCLDDKTEGMIKKRIVQSKNLQPGSLIPDLTLPNPEGKLINLKKINSEKTLLIFYSSECPHCKKLLPQIEKIYPQLKTKGIEVLAVSLDSSKTEWQNFIKDNSLTFLNVSDLQGWGSKALVSFYLYATPTMFVLDKERKIIGKPLTIEEINKFL